MVLLIYFYLIFAISIGKFYACMLGGIKSIIITEKFLSSFV